MKKKEWDAWGLSVRAANVLEQFPWEKVTDIDPDLLRASFQRGGKARSELSSAFEKHGHSDIAASLWKPARSTHVQRAKKDVIYLVQKRYDPDQSWQDMQIYRDADAAIDAASTILFDIGPEGVRVLRLAAVATCIWDDGNA